MTVGKGDRVRIHIGTDHAGFEVKELVVAQLREYGHEVLDHGAYSYEPEDDYPLPCIAAAEATVLDSYSLGVVLGGSSNGEQMAVNLVEGARAALVCSHETAILARSHNNANVISIGVRQHDPSEVVTLIKTALQT